MEKLDHWRTKTCWNSCPVTIWLPFLFRPSGLYTTTSAFENGPNSFRGFFACSKAERFDTLGLLERKIKSAAGSSENAPPGGEPKNQQECRWRHRWRQIKELDHFFHTRQWNVSSLFQQNRTEWFSIQSGSIHSTRRVPLWNFIQLRREMGLPFLIQISLSFKMIRLLNFYAIRLRNLSRSKFRRRMRKHQTPE